MKRINMMEKQISRIENKYQKTEMAFDDLVEDCAELDDFLRENNRPMPEMQLLRAYLQQYEDVRTSIKSELDYSKNQVKNLKDDFEDGLYDEAQRDEYITSEEKALNVIEARCEYFLDRFKKQSDFIKETEKQ